MNTEQLYTVYQKHPEICTDNRKVTNGCLFFSLKGEHFDGNKFALNAIENGAAFAIIDNSEYAFDERFLLVENVLKALQDLARYHRKQLNIPLIGITGTNGKTTTKELVWSVLSQKFNAFATLGNLNNHIGVPLSILSIHNDCEIAIIEMGANHQKEIEFLCRIAQPTHGMITNIGKAHLEGFGGIEGVRIGKGELYQFISETKGILFINADDSVLNEMSTKRGIENKITYGKAKDNFICAELQATNPFVEIKWQPGSSDSTKPIFIAKSNLSGIYNFDNIVSAICIGYYFKLSPEQINSGINAYQPLNNRSQILKTNSNTIICDYYNANPSSMKVALENIESIDSDSRVLILGDMFELGAESENEHRMILEKALNLGSDRPIFIGEEFYKLKGASKAEFYKTVQDAYINLDENRIKDAIVLVKGSRGMKLETLLPLL